uniref:FBA_2 domain-containing protein n=1 Tax=Panagrellus redivivus TaxID=6233 RepID=A0A7E4VYS7_PANRE
MEKPCTTLLQTERKRKQCNELDGIAALVGGCRVDLALQSGESDQDSWDDNQRHLQSSANSSSRIVRDVEFMQFVQHLYMKPGTYFCCRPKVENNKLHVQITVPCWVGIDAIEAVMRNWKIVKKITVIDLPTSVVHSLISLIGSTKDKSAITFLKLQGCVIHPDYLRYFINTCPNLRTIFLPRTVVIQGMNLLDIVVQGKRLESLESVFPFISSCHDSKRPFSLETTVGIRVPSYIFQWLKTNNRVFRTFCICPGVVINRNHLYSYIPFWETYLTFNSRHTPEGQKYRKHFNAQICIRTDKMITHSSMKRKELDQWMNFIVDANNNFFDSQLKRHGELRAAGEDSYIRTTVRAKQIVPEKRIIFDIPSTIEFDKLADDVFKKSLEESKEEKANVEACDNGGVKDTT